MSIGMGKHRKQEKHYLYPLSWSCEVNSDTNYDRYTNIDTDNDISNNITTISDTNNGTNINIIVW